MAYKFPSWQGLAELLVNKATNFSVLNSTLYPTTLAVSTYIGTNPTSFELQSNKATTFGTLNNTLYPTTLAVYNLLNPTNTQIIVVNDITSVSATNVTVYTFSPAVNSSTTVSIVYNVFGSASTTADVGTAIGGFIRDAGAPVLFGAAPALTISNRENLTPNLDLNLFISGNNVLLRQNAGAQTIKGNYRITLVTTQN